MPVETAKMSERGQIIVPKEIRDEIGAKKGTVFTFIVVGNQIVMRALDTEKIRRDLETFWEMRANTQKVSAKFIQREIAAARKELRARKDSH